MKNLMSKYSKMLVFSSIILMLTSTIIPAIYAQEELRIRGFESGPQYTEVIPVKKTTIVGYDDAGEYWICKNTD